MANTDSYGLVTPTAADKILSTQGGKTRNISYQKASEFFTGTETLATTAQTVRGAINEHEQDIININASLSELAKQNILINGGFRVNQRGASSYTGTKYTIDRWYLYDTNSKATVTKNSDGTITITNTDSNDVQLIQLIEEALELKPYTLSIKVKTITGTVKGWLQVYGNGSNYDSPINGFILSQGLNIKTGTVNFGLTHKVSLVVSAGASITLESVKLEKGSTATPFVPRQFAEELALCQRYYELRGDYLRIDSAPNYSANLLYLNGITYSVPKRVTPTINISNIWFPGWYDVSSVPQNLLSIIYNQANSLLMGIDKAIVGDTWFSQAKGKIITFTSKIDSEIY